MTHSAVDDGQVASGSPQYPDGDAWAMNRYTNLACAWAGPTFAVLFIVGFIVFANFLPPPSPGDSAEQTVKMYLENPTLFRIGLIFMMFGTALVAPFGISVAAQLRRREVGFPVLTYLQLAGAIFTMTLTALFITVWGLASFRAGETAAETTQMLNDLGWFLVLFPFPPGEIWFVAIAIAILSDHRQNAPYPRWLGWFNLWLAFLTLPAGLIVFFKEGAFAWNGVIAFYPPLAAFFVFSIVMSIYTMKAINKQDARQKAGLSSLPLT